MASCIHSQICSGCPWMGIPQDEQKSLKIKALAESLLKNGLSPVDIRYELPGELYLRDRVDLTYADGVYGFYEKNSRKIFSVQKCPQMSPALFRFFQELQKISLPLKKGSLRLRVSPQGERGLWLDFANEDVKHLFEEQTTLHHLIKLAQVEVGQRRKSLLWMPSENRFRLIDPVFAPWTRTWPEGQPLELSSLIGSFSQTGDRANQLLIERLTNLLTSTTAQKWVEFGCGNGNLTFPLAAGGRRVAAIEYDDGALAGLKQTLQQHPEFAGRICLHAGDFQKRDHFSFEDIEGILVNPPRSGLGNFLQPLSTLSKKPRDLIYISCFMDSFSRDGRQIQDLGYRLQELIIVDQFPQTPHFEILSRWSLS